MRKTPMEECYFYFHGYFSRYLNCANGINSRKASLLFPNDLKPRCVSDFPSIAFEAVKSQRTNSGHFFSFSNFSTFGDLEINFGINLKKYSDKLSLFLDLHYLSVKF